MSTTASSNRHTLQALTAAMRDVHRNLLDVVKSNYEREHGPIDAAHLLQLLTKEPQFGWMHELTEFMVVVDEALDQDAIATAEATSLLNQARQLFTPAAPNASEFYRRYVTYLQHHPSLTMAHAALRQLLVPI